MSLSLSLVADGLGIQIPLLPIAAPLWLLYALVTCIVAGGCWVDCPCVRSWCLPSQPSP
jgi:hypothetical protein